MIKTKIVATVGPASADEKTLGELIDAGVNIFRLNFSHGTLDTHGQVLRRIRHLTEQKRPCLVAVMGDLSGPKIRLGKVVGGQVELIEGGQVRIVRGDADSTAERLTSGYSALVDDVQVGQRVLIDDGNIELRVDDKNNDELICTVLVGGPIKDHKGINLPDTDISTPPLTDKDRRDLAWAIEHELDFVALSFVQRPQDLVEMRAFIDERGSDIQIVSKIEKPQALEQIDEIIELSDAVLVARGDLGVEMDVSRVPLLQKEIVLNCRRQDKPVIVATQMLQSMVESAMPTRAEVSDVANAILDHCDAVMLSAETAVGRYPVRAVQTMRRIANQTESFHQRHGLAREVNPHSRFPVATAMVSAAHMAAESLKPPVIVIWTEQGDSPRLMSKYRPNQLIIALAENPRICRRMAILYGVVPFPLQQCANIEKMLVDLDRVLIEHQWASVGQKVLVLTDTRPDIPGEIDNLLVHQVDRAD